MRFGIRSLLIAAALAATAGDAAAWGPHTEITQAALDALDPKDPLFDQLGPDAKRLAQYVWMADWRQQLLVRADEVFYTDDYLLFPGAPRHYQHICPEVKQTYAPFFRRALQAMRTESPLNAARWIGSLLHFTTDTGSPPHAAEILGPVHSKMENWVNAKLIHLSQYQPQLLGADDGSAEDGFLQRMEGLIAYSKERAQRCRADLDADRREAVEPVVLESALETARVTADLLHTLGVLAAKRGGAAGPCSFSGWVAKPKLQHPSLARLPVKIILLGTNYSTLTDDGGSFHFRHLPEGNYKIAFYAPGLSGAPMQLPITELSGFSLELEASATDGNLIRNPNLNLRWVSADGFDGWTLRKPPERLAATTRMRDWEGEWIPLEAGASYRLRAEWRPAATGTEAQVFLRTKAKLEYNALATDSAPVRPDTAEVVVTGSPEAAWAQVCIRTAQSPETLLQRLALIPSPPTP